jgi:hypothetical protein
VLLLVLLPPVGHSSSLASKNIRQPTRRDQTPATDVCCQPLAILKYNVNFGEHCTLLCEYGWRCSLLICTHVHVLTILRSENVSVETLAIFFKGGACVVTHR